MTRVGIDLGASEQSVLKVIGVEGGKMDRHKDLSDFDKG